MSFLLVGVGEGMISNEYFATKGCHKPIPLKCFLGIENVPVNRFLTFSSNCSLDEIHSVSKLIFNEYLFHSYVELNCV